MSPLTPKQLEILNFIETFSKEKGYAPSQAEIARAFGFRSLGTVQNYLVRLEREGAISKDWNSKRGLTVSRPTPESSLPLVGRVAAGRPIEAIEESHSFDLSQFLVPNPTTHEHFALQVVGDSMKDDGIFNGDVVILRKIKEAQNGQTVVALLDHEATLKTFYRKSGRIELHPANSNYKPIVISADEAEERGFRVEGLLVGVVRRVQN